MSFLHRSIFFEFRLLYKFTIIIFLMKLIFANGTVSIPYYRVKVQILFDFSECKNVEQKLIL